VGHSPGVIRRTLRPLAIAMGATMLLGVPALGAPPESSPSARPDRPERPERPDRPERPERPGRPAPNPMTPAPARPSNPATPPNPIATPGTGAPQGGGAGPSRTGAGGPGGTSTTGTVASLPPVPRGARVAGLSAGRGDVQVRYFADLGDVASASGHMAVIPALLARVSSDRSATVALRPLVVTGDANGTEAACALVAAIRPNRVWHVAHHLAAARVTRDGDWVNARVLRSIARRVPGLSARSFPRAATARTCFAQLNRFRREARRAGVDGSPAYVVRGDRGTVRLAAPASVQQVLDAIGDVA